MTTKKRTEIIIDGVVITLCPRSTKDGRTYRAKTRVYGAIEALAPDLTALEPEWVPETVGVDYDDATRLKGKIWRAWRDGTKKAVAERLSALMEKATDSLSSYAVTFSYKAGCTCGCSPGFVLDGTIEDGYAPADIWLSREDDGKE